MVKCPKCGSFNCVMKTWMDKNWRVKTAFIYCDSCGEGKEKVFKKPKKEASREG